MKKSSITKLVNELQHALSAHMNDEFNGVITDGERRRYLSTLNDGMPAELSGVEVMLMTRRDEACSELAMLIPEELMRFFVGRPITWYAGMIVEKRHDGIFFFKNRYGLCGPVPTLEGEVVLSREPLVTATFKTPRTEKT